MSYTVLARKYRSRTLAEVVGQEPIVTTLQNAIRSGRVHHGYLFCGTRGVGKTSTARVLAKSLNCLAVPQPTVEPCCQCDACLAIAEGEDLDVLEIDAASNTGVDNIRDLRSNASYRPARSRYKIYIIDEVHMLSTGAFNALLKTLEEPPGHVKFIMATTELHKVPATIQSRVQRFEFQTMAADTIARQLACILDAENVQADADVVRHVARCAQGSMRDALSLLDQLLSFGAERLDEAVAQRILPPTHDERLAALVEQLVRRDAAAALQTVDHYLDSGQTAERFCEAVIDYLRQLMLIRICGPESAIVDVPAALKGDLAAKCTSVDALGYVYMIGVLEELRRQVRTSRAGRALIDATVVRLAHADQFVSVAEALDSLSGPSPAPPPARSASPAGARLRETPGQGPGSRLAGRDAGRVGSRSTAVSSQEIKSARQDPMVRAALDRLGGTLVNVQRIVQCRPIGGSQPHSTGDD